MRQFTYRKDNPHGHCWAYHDGEIGAMTKLNGDRVTPISWGLDTALQYIKDGLFKELNPNDFMYLKEFNEYFNIIQTLSKKCTCDLSLLLIRGCTCGGI